MRRLLLLLIIIVVALSPVYSAQGLAITYGETTYSNQAIKIPCIIISSPTAIRI